MARVDTTRGFADARRFRVNVQHVVYTLLAALALADGIAAALASTA